jgi:dihydroorotate dehydrogenase electron transfer subunit
MKKGREEIIRRIRKDEIKFATVSGVLTTKPELIRLADDTLPEVEIITTKSYQVTPNDGNLEPIIVESDIGCYGNAVGLRNPGMERGLQDLQQVVPLRAILAVSLSANSIEDYRRLVLHFQDIADILELNFSCPHAAAGFGASIGTDPSLVFEYMQAIREQTNALLFPKLTPNVDDIGKIAAAAVNGGADGISAINTVGPECYTEPHTGEPVLYNPRGHKGGQSGSWIFDIAERKIREIRSSIGPEIPIIGIGGVSSGKEVRKMYAAGADAIGLGSVFARVSPHNRADFIRALKKDAEKISRGASEPDTSFSFLESRRLAEYRPFKIQTITSVDPETKILELDKPMEYKSSQFAFIWIPGIGEKPLSIAKSDPATFIVKRKGAFTNAVFNLKEGDRMMVRGVYGAAAPRSDRSRACIIAGGTGLAVAPRLAEQLRSEGKDVQTFFGVADDLGTMSDEELKSHYSPIGNEIEKWGSFFPVADRGTSARILSDLVWRLPLDRVEETAFYIIGHPNFMKKAALLLEKMGADKNHIFLSIETNTMCGLGLCGECQCGGKLTCKEGTFFSLAFLDRQGIDPEAVDTNHFSQVSRETAGAKHSVTII